MIEHLAADLQQAFPKLSGYSVRNLNYMRAFASAWPERAIMQQLAAQIPWMHNCVIKTVEHGWSRSVLQHHLDTELHKRSGKAPSNFARTLPPLQSDLALELLKDPYIFKPMELDESASERVLENSLLARLKDFLIELGTGFAFVGNQCRLEVEGDEFFLDLLFYHVRLHCYIVIELKVGDFKPEFVSKKNFYQTAVDNLIKTPQDGPTIGLILCRGKNKTEVEYTLRDAKSPVGVAEYRLLPENFKAVLPKAKQLKLAIAGGPTR